MPTKAGKRAPAATPAAARPRKAAKLSPHEEQLRAVAQALEGAPGLPETCCQMLLAALPTSLGAPADTRHPAQERLVGMVGESLAEVRAEKEAAVAQVGTEAAASEGRQTELQAAQTAAEAALEGKTKAAEDHKAALGSADAALAEAKAALAGGQRAVQAAKDAEAAKQAECEAFDATVAEHLKPLMEGSWEEGQPTGQQRVEAMQQVLQKAELDASVMASVGIVGAKRASERSTFDKMVLEQVATSLSEKAAALRGELAAMAPGLAEAAAAVAAKASEAELAEAKAQECKSTFEQAQAVRQESEALFKAAAQELRAYSAEAKKATRARDAAQADLDLFAGGPLAAFESLRRAGSKAAEAAAEAAAVVEEAASTSMAVGGA